MSPGLGVSPGLFESPKCEPRLVCEPQNEGEPQLCNLAPASCVCVRKRPKMSEIADEKQLDKWLNKNNRVTCKTVYFVSQSKSEDLRYFYMYLLDKNIRGLA